MNVLAVESSGKIASVAILKNEKIIYEACLGEQLTHSQTLLPMVEQALEMTQTSFDEIDLLAVDIGPGSFTGLRIGICSINVMGFAKSKKIAGISSLKTLAANAAYFQGWVCPLIDARNDQVYAAAYQWENGQLVERIPPFAGSITDWLIQLPIENKYLFLGDGARAQKDIIVQSNLPFDFAPANLSDLRAGSLAILASGFSEDQCLFEVQPMYLRASQAERMRTIG